ncbi:S41 family peptidase [Dyella caseinilytica]|uniref:Tail specific protease domain-containing protein n=1 Tax=Dyella caseinilytica TaxID=1849581 RepID=A0ABX7GNX9_9GAMM|nr:S41 family peptidase [Dyella caseinilytica]QRN52135.1 hypothetical protein ISN74_11555 [Dyella caseinilytica]GGA13624.1 hypothetical protein GCM10011408_38870 [Dyella caseinilytica]
MKMKVMLALLASLGLALAQAQTAPVSWIQSGAKTGYQVQGTGDPTTAQGAKASVTSSSAQSDMSGVVMAVSDAAPYRGKMVSLQADLSTRNADKGVTIFLAMYGPNGSLGFISSDRVPVLGDVTSAQRQIQIGVPSAATRLSYGVVLHGNGTVDAEHIRLIAAAPIVEVPPQLVLDKAITIVREYAFNTSKVDWATVEPQIRAMAANAKVSQDVYPAIRALLADLDDHHSYFQEPSLAELLSTQGGPQSPSVVELKPNGVGYISMPGYNGKDPQARESFADDMVQAITKLAPQVRCGWVVDLRSNTGGSMAPMLAGLGPLLGGDTLGSFRDAQGRLTAWQVGYGMKGNVPKGPDLSHASVAVLTGEHTASSGEVMAISLRGRANTRSFGAPTAGLTTSSVDFPLPDGSMIILATSIDLDRNGHVYGEKIAPDQPVDASDSKTDAVLNAAEAWLFQTNHCAH